MSELISVVLPVFNAQETIAAAVQSILGQTLREFELVVIDDGSTDDTAAIIREIRDPRLRLIEAAHQGVAAAANLGNQQAQGDFIARMDADDFAYAERLEKQLALLQTEQLDAVGCQVRIVDVAGERAPGMQRYERWINEETLAGEQIRALRFVELPLVNPTIFARRAYFELGFREGSFPEDYDLMLRAAAAGMRFGKIRQVLLDWTDGPTRLTRNDANYTPEAFERCRRMHLLDGPLAGVTQVDLWGVGQTGKSWLRWLQASGIHVRQAYEVNQRQVDQVIHGVQVQHPEAMPAADGTPLVIAVGADGARDIIRPHILKRGYEIGSDAWFVA
jgi:glycosyltransferase involved in cell wall biosynthesis